MGDFIFGLVAGVAITLVFFVTVYPKQETTFIEAYDYLIPKGLGDAKEAYKCKSVDGKYVFTPQGSFCKFN